MERTALLTAADDLVLLPEARRPEACAVPGHARTAPGYDSVEAADVSPDLPYSRWKEEILSTSRYLWL